MYIIKSIHFCCLVYKYTFLNKRNVIIIPIYLIGFNEIKYDLIQLIN